VDDVTASNHPYRRGESAVEVITGFLVATGPGCKLGLDARWRLGASLSK